MRRIVAVGLLLGFALTMIQPMPSSAKMSGFIRGDQNMHYVGPNWGFSLAFDPAEWKVVEESSDSRRDYLRLETTIDRVTIEGYAGFAGNASTCLYNHIEHVRSDPRVSRLELVPSEQGAGFEESWEMDVAYAHFSYDLTTDEGTFWIAQYIDCRTVKPGEAVVVFTHVAYAANYDEWEEGCCAFDPILGSLTLPRDAWEPTRNDPKREWWESDESKDRDVEVLRFVARTGDDGNGPPPSGYRFVAVRIRFTNTSERADYANASAVYLRDEYDVLYRPTSYRWEDVSGDRSQYYQLLDPGLAATATLFFSVPDGAAISSVHCSCFSDQPLVEERIHILNDRAGDLRNADQTSSPSAYVDRQGRERLIFSIKGSISSKPDLKYPVHIVNIGSRPILVDPEAFILHARARASDDVYITRIGAFRWELAPGDRGDQLQQLEPGDHAIIDLTFTPTDDSIYHELAFVVSNDQVVPIGGVANSIGGSTGRPRISRSS